MCLASDGRTRVLHDVPRRRSVVWAAIAGTRRRISRSRPLSPLAKWFHILLAMCLMVPAWASVCAWAGQDEETIAQTITAAVTGAATFSETRDRQAVLSLYADDYEGIQDGQAEKKEAIENWLLEYESELKQGSTLRFIGTVSHVRLHHDGPTAWATYDYVFQAVRHGQLEGQDSGKCTSLLRKEASVWRIFHEHCSKTKSP
jgi:ketosteroid isomerase-like protein